MALIVAKAGRQILTSVPASGLGVTLTKFVSRHPNTVDNIVYEPGTVNPEILTAGPGICAESKVRTAGLLEAPVNILLLKAAVSNKAVEY
jgi:hypothetical protein